MGRAGIRAGRTKKLKLAVALMYGGGCEDCRGIELCKDEPSESEPIEGEYGSCMTCGGRPGFIENCPECGGTGKVKITECPLKIVKRETWELIDCIELYLDNGLPPVAGGQLDQAAGFLRAVTFVKNEKAMHKARLKI